MLTYASTKDHVLDFFNRAGIDVNGTEPWDIQIHDDRFYSRVMAEGSLGLGNSYMDEWWDVDKLDEFFFRLCRSHFEGYEPHPYSLIFNWLSSKIVNMQSKSRAFIVGKKHYDIGNDLFECMLDKRMTYSCGYWKDAVNLDEAQEAKLELVCRKMELKAGMRLLDIGCGWASFAKYAAEKYGVEVTGITISKQQYDYALDICRGLPVSLKLEDYRDIQGNFDRIVSIGQLEHVGYRNYSLYCSIIGQHLAKDGLALLHTIGSNKSSYSGDAWIEEHIFPNGMLPSIKQLSDAFEGHFIVEDWHNFGVYYDQTLMAWHSNFVAHWPALQKKYDRRFFRMWSYYLLYCAALFRARKVQLWQIVLSPAGVLGGYHSIR